MAKLSEAIRKAMDVHGSETGKETTEAIRSWIKINFPDLTEKVDSGNFNTTLSGLRKKAREETNGEEPAQASPPPAQPDHASTAQHPPAREPVPAASTPAPVDVKAVIEALETLRELVGRFGKENVRLLLDSIGFDSTIVVQYP